MQNKPINQRAGIALVMVLGVLSLMVLMAVSFAISMRTERVAAGNYVDTVRARQLAQVGLVRALDQIYNLCGTNLADSNLVYPRWSVTNSWTSTQANAAADLLKGSASNYVPRSLWAAASAAANPVLASNHWLEIYSKVGTDPDTGTNLAGRVAFMILNCSGLLDANFVGGADRGIGTNPVELALGAMTEAGSGFANTRNTDVRYETQEELNELAEIDFPATNLFVYSSAPAGYWSASPAPASVATQVNLAGDLAALRSRREHITNAFVKTGFSVDQAGLLFTNLLHYLDPAAMTGPQFYDGIGGGEFSNAFVAPVPLINELVLDNKVTLEKLNDTAQDVHRYKLETTLWVELWNPFVRSDPMDVNIRLPSGQSYGGIGQPPPAKIECGAVNPRGFLFKACDFPDTIIHAPAGSIDVGVSNLSVEVWRADINMVDKVFPYRDLRLNITLPGTIEGDTQSGSVTLECVDPRFNWDPNDLSQWKSPPTNSANKINQATLDFWSVDTECDQTPEMFMAYTNQVHSVGELGYLVYAPWRTIKLYGPRTHPVMDYFSIENSCGDWVTNVIWRGRVNPSTPNREVLATVFADMPLDEYPGQPAPGMTPLTPAQALAVAAFITNNTAPGAAAASGLTNLSDLCRLDWDTPFASAFAGVVTNELQREAFIRNTAGLFNTRGQVYTVLIEAHVASSGNIPKKPSRQRAVAVVWRDAWTGEMIVRYLKWLPD